MKIKSLILAMVACAGLFTACSNDLTDEVTAGNGQDEKGNAYASFSFIMPNGGGNTRSNPTGGAEGDGKEQGLAVENQITNVNIYLFENDKCAKIITLDRKDFTPTNQGSSVEYKTVAPFEVATGNYNVYLIVNPTRNLQNISTETTYADFLTTVESVPAKSGEYCTDNKFMMTTADKKEKTAVEVTSANTKESPAEITLNVERTAAKITFSGSVANAFSITDGAGKTIGSVKFDAFKVINTRNSAYNFKRVGNDKTSAVQGEKETLTNFVIENLFSEKTAKFNKDLFQPNYSRKYTDYVAFRKLTGGNQILAYCLENTMPIDAQIEGYTTTVIFRAKATIEGINDGENANKDLYRYNNKFYTSLDEMIKDNQSIIGSEVTEESLKAIATKTGELNKLGIDFYTQGYCYYNYQIRHNNNNDDNKMGIMEFAIVRNNIYKLSINSVAQLGNTTSGTPGAPDPTDPTKGEADNDPENPNPEMPGDVVKDPKPLEPSQPEIPIDPVTPDEENSSYLNVTIEVLDWTVRNNDIDL